MAYLTLDEYKAFGLIDVDDDEFAGLLMRASLAIDSATRNHFATGEFELDKAATFIASRFKQAVAMQIEYIAKTGIETATDAIEQGQVASSSIGSTSVSMRTSGGSDNGDSSAVNYVSPDAKIALSGTGLLYAGVAYVR